jgi:hypothetical protein
MLRDPKYEHSLWTEVMVFAFMVNTQLFWAEAGKQNVLINIVFVCLGSHPHHLGRGKAVLPSVSPKHLERI